MKVELTVIHCDKCDAVMNPVEGTWTGSMARRSLGQDFCSEACARASFTGLIDAVCRYVASQAEEQVA